MNEDFKRVNHEILARIYIFDYFRLPDSCFSLLVHLAVDSRASEVGPGGNNPLQLVIPRQRPKLAELLAHTHWIFHEQPIVRIAEEIVF